MYICLNNNTYFKQFHALNYHVPVCFNFSEYGFHFPHTIFPSGDVFIVVGNSDVPVLYNIIAEVKLLRDLLVFRRDEQGFLSLEKIEMQYSTLWRHENKKKRCYIKGTLKLKRTSVLHQRKLRKDFTVYI